MQVEIEADKKGSILTFYLDGEFWRQGHASIFGWNPPIPNPFISLDAANEWFAGLEYRQGKLYCLRRLAKQSLTCYSLMEALERRSISQDVIQRLIKEMNEAGYLNDQEWMQHFICRESDRKIGPKGIARKLFQKGIAPESIQEFLEKEHSPVRQEQQEETIALLLKGKFSKRDLGDFRERQKVIASLVRRGFDLTAILDQIRNLVQH